MSKIIDEINGLDGVKGRICLKNAEISRSERFLSVGLFSDFAQEDYVLDEINRLIDGYLPDSFRGKKVAVEKIVTEQSFVINAVRKFMITEHQAIADSVYYDKIEIFQNRYRATLKLPVEKSAYSFITEKGVDKEIADCLSSRFVEDFSVSVTDAGEVAVDITKLDYVPTERDLYKREPRKLKVDEVSRLFDDDATATAFYIADTKNYLGEAYVAGAITRIEERETKNGKPFFSIEINDRTGTLSGMIFPNKDKIPKLKKLAPGIAIIARGDFQMRGEYKNFTFRSINLCIFPENFVPVSREARPCPKEYSLISPEPLTDETQDNFLIDKSAPDCFKGREFVVFDLETTGKEIDDKITEIGAVKIVDGKMTEYFSTLVNPGKPIPKMIVELTGITDEMVSDAPSFEDVCADFYKFCYGSTLVAHNIDFDSRFIKKQSEPLDFLFDNPLMDTLALARETIKDVSNYKLNTLCDKFDIKFRHHRAYCDAEATGKLFVEIIRLRGSLPF